MPPSLATLVFCLFLCSGTITALTDHDGTKWKWISGNNIYAPLGVYGEQGIASTDNYPGARRGAVACYDSTNQELWLFGGKGLDDTNSGFLNDLWIYRVQDSTWTWVSGNQTVNQAGVYGAKGVPEIHFAPGGREGAVGWCDGSTQEFWLFGGRGYGVDPRAIGRLNDLWRYRMNDSTWTWIAGTEELDFSGVYAVSSMLDIEVTPGARHGALGWYDETSKALWLFGGFGKAQTTEGYLNDLWTYKVKNPGWVYMAGSKEANQQSVYGEMGTPAEENVPAARSGAVGWYDATSQGLWLFGGVSYYGRLNDVWRYQESMWTWMSGSNINDTSGVYGNKGKPSTEHYPGARSGAVGWYDSTAQEFWLFGGEGNDADADDGARISRSIGASPLNALAGYLNDLWRYRLSDSTWTWIAGSNTINQLGKYVKEDTDYSNTPSARFHAVGWYDSSTRKLWLFGGECYPITRSVGYYLNDMWSFYLDDLTWSWASGSSLADQLSVYSPNPILRTDYVPGVRYGAVGWYDESQQEFWLFGGYGIAESSIGYLNDLWVYRVKNSTWEWIAGTPSINRRGIYGMKGNASTENYPGARSGAVGWYDSTAQEFWLFGGKGYSAEDLGYLNDLWLYRVNDSTWTWVSGSNTTVTTGVYDKGPTDIPGGREAAVGWYDGTAQEFWLFGGYGNAMVGIGYLNDLWKYRVNDSTWIWISGSEFPNQGGVYGEKGKASTENYPGARSGAVGWFDSTAQEFWVFGGSAHSAIFDRLNDLWKFRVNESTWTWVSGNSTPNQSGVFGEIGKASTEYYPGARSGAVGWYDSTVREFWLFGGSFFTDLFTDTEYSLNDLWRYRVDDSTWTWFSGSAALNEPGFYGTKGNYDASNVLGARWGALGWYDSTTHELGLFGGAGITSTRAYVYLNDVWTASIPVPELPPQPCPPLHQMVNNTCIPLDCSSDACVIEGDVIVNGSIGEMTTVTIIGAINVTGDVTITGEVTMTLSPGAVLHVGNCLVLDDQSQIVVVVNSTISNSGDNGPIILATYNASCSSLDIVKRVSIESVSLDECRDGIPSVRQQPEDGNSGRVQLELVFQTNDSSECTSGSEVNVLAIALSVSIAVLVVAVIVLVLAVPKVRQVVFPFASRKRITTVSDNL